MLIPVTLTVLVRCVDESTDPVLRHKRERPARELDPIHVFAPVSQELVEVCLGYRGIVGAADLRQTLGALGLRLE